MVGVYTPEEMARQYLPASPMLFGEGGVWTTTASAAFALDNRLLTFDRGRYRRRCLYKLDEACLIAEALAARPTREPAVGPTMGNRLR
jgi:hypothetical protein